MEGFGEGFFDFLDNIENVVGKSTEIKEGKHIEKLKSYSHQKKKFEVEDDMSI